MTALAKDGVKHKKIRQRGKVAVCGYVLPLDAEGPLELRWNKTTCKKCLRRRPLDRLAQEAGG